MELPLIFLGEEFIHKLPLDVIQTTKGRTKPLEERLNVFPC